jgi:hypothetical protein
MAGNVSKNARREGAKVMMSRWGGPIKMKAVSKMENCDTWLIVRNLGIPLASRKT